MFHLQSNALVMYQVHNVVTDAGQCMPSEANTARVAAPIDASSVQYILRVSSVNAAATSVLSVMWPFLYSGLHYAHLLYITCLPILKQIVAMHTYAA